MKSRSNYFSAGPEAPPGAPHFWFLGEIGWKLHKGNGVYIG